MLRTSAATMMKGDDDIRVLNHDIVPHEPRSLAVSLPLGSMYAVVASMMLRGEFGPLVNSACASGDDHDIFGQEVYEPLDQITIWKVSATNDSHANIVHAYIVPYRAVADKGLTKSQLWGIVGP